jgi:hypothetical protein
MQEPDSRTRAERAAAARAAAKAAREAAALRANLHRRKAQSRAKVLTPGEPVRLEGPEKCR